MNQAQLTQGEKNEIYKRCLQRLQKLSKYSQFKFKGFTEGETEELLLEISEGLVSNLLKVINKRLKSQSIQKKTDILGAFLCF